MSLILKLYIRRVIAFVFILPIFCLPLFSQNLIPNGSFESLEIYTPEKWEFLSGTPDIFNLSDIKNNYHWQTNKPYFKNVKSKGFVGIAFSDSFTEVLGVKLETPLVSGKIYQLSTNVLTSSSCKTGLEKITIGIVDSKIEYAEQPKNFKLNTVELTNEKQFMKGLSWHKVENTFVADGNEQYIYIGNFNGQNAAYIKGPKEILINNEESNSCNYIIFDFIELTTFKKEPIVDKVIVLEDITFEFGKAIIRKEAQKKLNPISSEIQAIESKIKIVGHTDNVGNEMDNKTLSLERANAIRQYLEDRGISSDRIQVEGVGEVQPKASNETEEGRGKNRRVEIIILN